MKEYSPYKSLTEWCKNAKGAYDAAKRLGLYDEICETFGWVPLNVKKKPKGFWNVKENIIKSTKPYESFGKWSAENQSPYSSAIKNGWLDECTKDLIRTNKPKGYWTKELCFEDTKTFKTLNEWGKLGKASHSAARENGWYDEIKKTLFPKSKSRLKNATFKQCSTDAKKYNCVSNWEMKSGPMYRIAKKNGWLDECKTHFKQKNKPHWDIKENIINSIINSNELYISHWQKKNSGAYKAVLRNGWLDECKTHFKQKNKPHGYWTKERCVKDAKKYKKISHWQKHSNTAYHKAWKNYWLDECKKHMNYA
tara:strand:- start:216 stop:1142 length:927 start_codon:yes stop_codon:yes gene_type:complete